MEANEIVQTGVSSADSPSFATDGRGANDDHFGTDHFLPNLKRHTISGGVVTMSAQVAKFVMNLGSTVIWRDCLLREILVWSRW